MLLQEGNSQGFDLLLLYFRLLFKWSSALVFLQPSHAFIG
jgi:hypothetical protein